MPNRNNAEIRDATPPTYEKALTSLAPPAYASFSSTKPPRDQFNENLARWTSAGASFLKGVFGDAAGEVLNLMFFLGTLAAITSLILIALLYVAYWLFLPLSSTTSFSGTIGRLEFEGVLCRVGEVGWSVYIKHNYGKHPDEMMAESGITEKGLKMLYSHRCAVLGYTVKLP